MTRVIFRCDASQQIGSGHVIRCRNLARVLQQQGAEVIFVCRQHTGDFIHILEQEFRVVCLPPVNIGAQLEQHVEASEITSTYTNWLGCSQSLDADQTISALHENQIYACDWLVVDHYSLDSKWEHQVLASMTTDAQITPKLLVIDDLANRPHLADILLDQNFFGQATQRRYEEIVPDYCRKLLGPQYALLSPEYAQLSPSIPIRNDIRRILIFFGGADSHNCTLKALEALSVPELSDLAVDVVVGKQNQNIHAIETLASRRPNTTIFKFVPSLAALITRADLAIGAGGVTTWERASLRLPSLVVISADNQRSGAIALHNQGYIHLLGDADNLNVSNIVETVMAFRSNVLHLTKHHCLCDGYGTQRVALALLGCKENNIQLRSAINSDESILLHWANDPSVRAVSLNTNFIKVSDHHKWFISTLSDQDKLHFIASCVDGCPIGQIRFDRDKIKQHIRISMTLDQCARQLGLSRLLLLKGIIRMAGSWGCQLNLVAEILNSNLASRACFERIGFIQVESDLTQQGFSKWQLCSDQLHEVIISASK